MRRDIRFPAAGVFPLLIDPFFRSVLKKGWDASLRPMTFYHSQTGMWHDDSTAMTEAKHSDSNMACWDYVG
jgi:hypothetical protein